MKPKLLNNSQLAWSPVVANNAMNRKRKAFGINSYEKDIRLNPVDFIKSKFTSGEVRWLDLCCGEGNALIQTAQYFESKGLSHQVQLEGIDLVDFFSDYEGLSNLSLIQKDLQNWEPTVQYDLITMVHGLHYIGDKLSLIQKVSNALKEDGLFIGNLDLKNIKIQGIPQTAKAFKKWFKDAGMQYNSRTKILKVIGRQVVDFKLEYLGADDKAGPNYTGQAVVDSYYASETLEVLKTSKV